MNESLLRVEDVKSIRVRLEKLHAQRNEVSGSRNGQRVWERRFLQSAFVVVALTGAALLVYVIHPRPWTATAVAVMLFVFVVAYLGGLLAFLLTSLAVETWQKMRRRYLYKLENVLRYETVDIAAANDIAAYPVLAVRKCLDDNRLLRGPDRKALGLGVGLGAIATFVTVVAKFFDLPHFNGILGRISFQSIYATAMALLVIAMTISLWRWLWDVELRDDTRVLEQAEAIIAERLRMKRMRLLAGDELAEVAAELDEEDDDERGKPHEPRHAA